MDIFIYLSECMSSLSEFFFYGYKKMSNKSIKYANMNVLLLQNVVKLLPYTASQRVHLLQIAIDIAVWS